jgi:hypothetical protein
MNLLIVPGWPLPCAIQPYLKKSSMMWSLCWARPATSGRNTLWEFSRKIRAAGRAARAARSLACLGDERVIPYARSSLESNSPPEQVLDLVFAYVYVGKLEDIPRLRAIHRVFLGNEKICLEIRRGAASAILAILGEDSSLMSNRVMEQIRPSFSDNVLWKEILAARDSTLARVF